MIYVMATKFIWLTMGLLALDNGPIPLIYKWNAMLFVGMLVSAVLFWKYPLVAVAVAVALAWLDLFFIATEAFLGRNSPVSVIF